MRPGRAHGSNPSVDAPHALALSARPAPSSPRLAPRNRPITDNGRTVFPARTAGICMSPPTRKLCPSEDRNAVNAQHKVDKEDVLVGELFVLEQKMPVPEEIRALASQAMQTRIYFLTMASLISQAMKVNSLGIITIVNVSVRPPTWRSFVFAAIPARPQRGSRLLSSGVRATTSAGSPVRVFLAVLEGQNSEA